MEVNVLFNVNVKVALDNPKGFCSCVMIFNKFLMHVPYKIFSAVPQLYLLCPNLAQFVPLDC